eukprot:7993808-Alexandrium_andersonii.AAC.1
MHAVRDCSEANMHSRGMRAPSCRCVEATLLQRHSMARGDAPHFRDLRGDFRARSTPRWQVGGLRRCGKSSLQPRARAI